MNKYGLIAQEHWRKHASSRYESLESPEEYFEALGTSLAVQIDATAAALERQLPANLTDLERLGQMNAIRRQAEELVMTEHVYSVETEPASLREELEEMLGDLPSASSIRTSIDQVREDAEREAELEGSSTVSLTDEQSQRLEQLTALLPLVTTADVDEMTEPEIRDRILALRPFWNPDTRSLMQP